MSKCIFVDRSKRKFGFDSEITKKAGEIDKLITALKEHQNSIRPRRWLDIYSHSYNGYMCFTTTEHLKCFVNIRMLSESNCEIVEKAKVEIEVLKRGGCEVKKEVIIRFDDMGKAKEDVNNMLNEVYKILY